MAEGIESGVGHVWQTKQTRAGTIERSDAATMRHLRKADDDGGLRAAKTLGSEEWADGRSWGSPVSFVHEVGGMAGSLKVQGQLVATAVLCAQLFGSDIVTGAADPYTHTISSGTATPALQTIYQTAGVAVGPVRQAFYDAKITKLAINAGQEEASKTLHCVEDIMALFAAQTYATDPVATDSGVDPILWTQGVTRLNGTAMPEISGDTVEADARLSVHRGQRAAPAAWIYGKGEIMRTVDAIVTDATLPEMLNVLYGSRTPAGGTAVTERVVQLPIETVYTQEAARRVLTITTPLVEIRPDDWAFGAPAANGGARQVAFGGLCKAGGSPAITIVALTADAAAYV